MGCSGDKGGTVLFDDREKLVKVCTEGGESRGFGDRSRRRCFFQSIVKRLLKARDMDVEAEDLSREGMLGCELPGVANPALIEGCGRHLGDYGALCRVRQMAAGVLAKYGLRSIDVGATAGL